MPPKKRTAQQASPRKAGPVRAQAARSRQARRPFYTEGGSAFRHGVEQRSAPLLVLLTRAPRAVLTLLPLALFLLGLFLPLPYGYVAAVLFLAFTGWLAYLSWPATDARARAVRVLMFVLVAALIVVRVVRA